VCFCITVALKCHVLDTCWAIEFSVFIFGLYFLTDERWFSLRNHLHNKLLRRFIFVSVFCYNTYCPPWQFNCCFTNECMWYIRSILTGGKIKMCNCCRRYFEFFTCIVDSRSYGKYGTQKIPRPDWTHRPFESVWHRKCESQNTQFQSNLEECTTYATWC
jgi:hypothetical protein